MIDEMTHQMDNHVTSYSVVFLLSPLYIQDHSSQTVHLRISTTYMYTGYNYNFTLFTTSFQPGISQKFQNNYALRVRCCWLAIFIG